MATRMEPGASTTAKKKIATYGKASRKRPTTGFSPYAKETPSPLPPRSLAESSKSDANGARRLGDNGRSKVQTIVEEATKGAYDDYDFPPDEPPTHRFAPRSTAPTRSAVAKPTVKRKIPQATPAPRQAKKQRSSSPETAPTTNLTVLPAVNAPTTKPAPRAARVTRAKSTPPEDVVMQDAAESMPFSPATVHTLDKLSVSSRNRGLRQQDTVDSMRVPPAVAQTASKPSLASRNRGLRQQEIPFRPTAKPRADVVPAPQPVASEEPIEIASSPPAAIPTAKPRRRRLIDTLAAQADPSSDEGDDDDDMEGNIIASQRSQKEQFDQEIFAAIDRLDSEPSSQQAKPIVFERPAAQLAGASRRPGLKYTYSSQRSYLADEPMGDSREDLLAQLSQPLLPTESSKLSAFDMDEDEDEGPSTTGAIRSVHELRQAGANNRFADELDDIVDRIGAPSAAKPSSSRRGALFELFTKMQDKAFLRQFRSHNGESSLFKNFGREKDVIAGYAMMCILLTLLNTNALSVHLVQQLREEQISELLALLLQHDLDIAVIARDRKSNVSKHAQSSLTAMKSTILKMSNMWKSTATPSRLSPRTLALKALERLLDRPKLTAAEDQIISADVSSQLFTILSSACQFDQPEDSEVWTAADNDGGVDLFLVLWVLDIHSTCAAQFGRSLQWTSEDLNIAADLLQAVLRFRGECSANLECTALKLVVNIANNNATAQRIFVDKGLFLGSAEAACKTFDETVEAIKKDDLPSSTTIDSLVLMLGIMINFSEHDPEAGQHLINEDGQSPVDRLIQIFLDCRLLTAEADSVEKSHVNVSFGYLAVLLGYLCHYRPIRQRFESLHPGRNLEPLLSSIRQFSEFQKLLEASTEGHDPHGEPAGFSGRLQELANHLQSAY